MKRIALLPTLCTLANGVCGFAAMVFAARLNVAAPLQPPELAAYVSGWLLLAAMGFDMLDGYLARRSRSASAFGAELDSLCDAISFGVAPAFLLLHLGAPLEQRLARDAYLVVALLYVVCTVLRLARFNVQTDLDVRSHRVFCGLPSPGAAGCLAAMVILYHSFNDPRFAFDKWVRAWVPQMAPVAALAVALLMVSRLPYPHLVNQVLRGRRHFSHLIELILVVALIILFRELALLIMFWGYAASGPIGALIGTLRPRSKAAVPGAVVQGLADKKCVDAQLRSHGSPVPQQKTRPETP
ncbi:MAG: CDP-diacylglycerol--serine O-phosphatidyltransferase [Gemmataceae bacterium]